MGLTLSDALWRLHSFRWLMSSRQRPGVGLQYREQCCVTAIESLIDSATPAVMNGQNDAGAGSLKYSSTRSLQSTNSFCHQPELFCCVKCKWGIKIWALSVLSGFRVHRGDRNIAIAAPRTWNSLPESVASAPSFHSASNFDPKWPTPVDLIARERYSTANRGGMIRDKAATHTGDRELVGN